MLCECEVWIQLLQGRVWQQQRFEFRYERSNFTKIREFYEQLLIKVLYAVIPMSN
jgi:hypothetical protein